MPELIQKIHDFDAKLIDLENRIANDENDIRENRKAIRANREKAWFAYDATIDHESRLQELEEAEDE